MLATSQYKDGVQLVFSCSVLPDRIPDADRRDPVESQSGTGRKGANRAPLVISPMYALAEKYSAMRSRDRRPLAFSSNQQAGLLQFELFQQVRRCLREYHVVR